MNKDSIKEEYDLFTNADHLQPPPVLAQAIRRRVHADLNPSFQHVLGKFSGIHLGSAALSLTICPQFGLGPLFGQHGLMHYFMYFGDVACVALCGAFFLAFTMLASFVLMRPEEWRVLRPYSLPLYSTVSIVSLLFFVGLNIIGAVDGIFLELGFLLTWAIAAVATAKAMELGLRRVQI